MKNKKRLMLTVCVLASIILIAFCILFIIINNSNISFYFENGIWLKHPNQKEIVFSSKTQYGSELMKWHYKKNISKMIEEKGFLKINDENVAKINQYLDTFSTRIDEQNLNSFRNFNLNEIINTNNYYYLKDKGHYSETYKEWFEGGFILMIFDKKNNDIYFFDFLEHGIKIK